MEGEARKLKQEIEYLKKALEHSNQEKRTLVEEVTALLGKVGETAKIRKEAEEARTAAATAAAATAVIKGLIDVVGMTDMEGRIIQINEAVEAWGYKKEDLIGKPVAQVIAKNSLPKLMEERKKTLERGELKNLELVGLKKDGSEFPVLVNVSLMKDAEGKPIGRIVSLRDITELKRLQEKEKAAAAENARAEEAEKYSKEIEKDRKVLDNIIELNPYSVQICDAEGHHIRANTAFKKLFGSTPPPEWSLFNDPLLKKAGASELLEKLKKGETIKIPAIWYNAHDVSPEAPDNPICLGATTFPVLDNKGNINFIVNMHEDITRSKRAEEEREKYSKELEAKVKELEEFHDVAVGRELKMIELEEEIEKLERKLKKGKRGGKKR